MEKTSYKKEFEQMKIELKDLVCNRGVFEKEDGTKLPWKNYSLKVRINGIVMDFKLNKVFNDTIEEMIVEIQDK